MGFGRDCGDARRHRVRRAVLGRVFFRALIREQNPEYVEMDILGGLGSLGIVVGGVLLAAFGIALYTVKKLIIIVPPNQAAVITGRRRALGDGTNIGYRTVSGGRTIRVPIIEEVQ